MKKRAKRIVSATLALSLFGSVVYAGTVLQTYKTARGDFEASFNLAGN